MRGDKMKVYKLQEFGDLEKLVAGEEPIPTLTPKQVLVRQVAIAIEPYDIAFCAGNEGPHTLPVIPGTSIAGEVVALGDAVTGFKIGDMVVASRYLKTYAEYVPVNQRMLAHIPTEMTVSQAVSVAVSGQTAYQMMRHQFNILPGQRVLIHGGMGNVGQIAIQLALNMGADVYTTARTVNVAKLKAQYPELNVIDYTQTDLEQENIMFDAILDTVGGETLKLSLELVKTGGKLISLVAEPITNRTDITVSQEYLNSNGEDLSGLLVMFASGTLNLPQINVVPLTLANLRNGYESVATKHYDGKYVLVNE